MPQFLVYKVSKNQISKTKCDITFYQAKLSIDIQVSTQVKWHVIHSVQLIHILKTNYKQVEDKRIKKSIEKDLICWFF